MFNKQPRNHPQHRREVIPGSSGMRNEKPSRRRPNILGRKNYIYVSSTIRNCWKFTLTRVGKGITHNESVGCILLPFIWGERCLERKTSPLKNKLNESNGFFQPVILFVKLDFLLASWIHVVDFKIFFWIQILTFLQRTKLPISIEHWENTITLINKTKEQGSM